jgi:hypothetical protein
LTQVTYTFQAPVDPRITEESFVYAVCNLCGKRDELLSAALQHPNACDEANERPSRGSAIFYLRPR